MADSKSYLTASMKAGKNLSLYQYCIVTDVTAQANFVQFATSSTSWPIGILMNKPDSSGEAAEIAHTGMVKVKLGAACTSGSMIVANASGFGVSCTTSRGLPLGRLVYGGSKGDVCLLAIGARARIGGATIASETT